MDEVEPEPDTVTRRPRTKEERDQLRRALQHRYGRPTAKHEAVEPPAQPPAAPLPPTSWSSLPDEYARGIIQDQLIPAAESCYEDIAAKGAGGALTLSVAVIGDEELGGVIDRIDVNPEKTSIEGDLTECVRQSAYDMEFEPPEQGQGVVEFEFTIEFSDDEKL
ncbi:hypothetical protein DB30_06978 [Enhygromyxa salina]|uniref:Gram-negative bacterial tonB protein n=2 Tax=Enhygromyxa salina TaxID=215803 RepID=A0A0C1Z9J1_9BACT|nr:hypothetical protein DB30_06978 [Enhygromyxa salina]